MTGQTCWHRDSERRHLELYHRPLSEGSHSSPQGDGQCRHVTTTSAVTATIDTTAPAETISSTIGTDTGATTTMRAAG